MSKCLEIINAIISCRDQTDEIILMLPAADLEQITIWSMKFENEDFVRDLPVYSKYRDWEGFVLELSAIRPDGQFGTPNFEYIEMK